MAPVVDEQLNTIAVLAAELRELNPGADMAPLFQRVFSTLAKSAFAIADGAFEESAPGASLRGLVAVAIATPNDKHVQAASGEAVSALMDENNPLAASFEGLLAGFDDVEPCRKFGLALRRQQWLDESGFAFLRALKIDPTDLESGNHIAAILRDSAHYQEALHITQYLLALHPADPWAHVQKGNILTRMDRPYAAVEAYSKALEIDSDLKGVQTALGRQRTLIYDLPGASRAFLNAIEHDPKDRRALEGLADVLSVRGLHAESVIWYRRAFERRPRSNSLKRKLANALLLREHWQAGQDLLRDISTEVPGATWQGEQRPGRVLVFAHQPGSSEIETLFGIGLARTLAESGQQVVCVCPDGLAGTVNPLSPALEVANADTQPVSSLLDRDDFGAYAPLSEVIRLFDPSSRPLNPWLTRKGRRVSERIENIGFISGAPPTDNWPGLEAIRSFIADTYDTRVVYMDARATAEKAIASLKTIDLAITDDALTAAGAAAIGCPSVFLVPTNCHWLWGDRGQASPWAAAQTLVRVGPDSDIGDIQRHVSSAIQSSARQDTGPAPAHRRMSGRADGQELAETIDRVAPYLAMSKTAEIEAKPLTGGTRNTVYQLHCEGDDRVLRLGRFPPPRRGFYAKEITNMKIAADAGLSPSVDFTDPLDGSMLIGYVEGETMRSRSIRESENAIAIGHLFRELHQLPGFHDDFDIFSKIERNARRLRRARSQGFLKQQTFNDLVTRLITMLRKHKVPFYATHNDPLTRNFIRHKDRMMLIDWECSGLGDPHWEVGAMSAQVGLDEDVWDAYLTAYFGSEAHPARCRIPLYEALCRYYWWTDALTTGVTSPDDPSWQNKADKWRGWFTDTVTAKTFTDAVKAAESYRWDPSHSPASAEADITA